jgi:hypothetical protein
MNAATTLNLSLLNTIGGSFTQIQQQFQQLHTNLTSVGGNFTKYNGCNYCYNMWKFIKCCNFSPNIMAAITGLNFANPSVSGNFNPNNLTAFASMTGFPALEVVNGNFNPTSMAASLPSFPYTISITNMMVLYQMLVILYQLL